MKKQSENKINSIIQNVLKNINGLIDVNTAIGTPIKMDNGDYVFPVSKVTVGVLSGGGEYGKLGVFTKNNDLPFSAGNGAIVSIKPSGFLVKNNVSYKLISTSNDPIEKIVDLTTDFISKMQTEDRV